LLILNSCRHRRPRRLACLPAPATCL